MPPAAPARGRRGRAGLALALLLARPALGAAGADAAPAPPPPLAEEAVARARTLSVRGREAYEAHEWERSLQAYAEAYAAMPLPAFLFNIAQAHRQQGRLAPARLYYQRYLQEAQPEGAQRELVSGLIAEMAEQERRSEVGQAVAAVQHGAYGGLGTGQARPVWEQWWFWAGVTAVVVGGTVLASTASGPAASPGRTAPVRPALSF